MNINQIITRNNEFNCWLDNVAEWTVDEYALPLSLIEIDVLIIKACALITNDFFDSKYLTNTERNVLKPVYRLGAKPFAHNHNTEDANNVIIGMPDYTTRPIGEIYPNIIRISINKKTGELDPNTNNILAENKVMIPPVTTALELLEEIKKLHQDRRNLGVDYFELSRLIGRYEKDCQLRDFVLEEANKLVSNSKKVKTLSY